MSRKPRLIVCIGAGDLDLYVDGDLPEFEVVTMDFEGDERSMLFVPPVGESVDILGAVVNTRTPRQPVANVRDVNALLVEHDRRETGPDAECVYYRPEVDDDIESLGSLAPPGWYFVLQPHTIGFDPAGGPHPTAEAAAAARQLELDRHNRPK